MTKTELKVKLAEECLFPANTYVIGLNDDGTTIWGINYDYSLAEKIIHFLDENGVPLSD